MRSQKDDATTHRSSTISNKVIVLTWGLSTIIWSIFTPPHRTYAARCLLFQPAWIFRIWRGDRTWAQDLFLCLFLHAIYGYVAGSWRPYQRADFAWLDFSDPETWIYINVFSLLGVCGAFAGGIVRRGQRLDETKSTNGQRTTYSIDEQLLPPLLIGGRTTHTRLFPKKHAFSYSYLMVGVPIGVRGTISSALSVDSDRSAWFNVHSADFLERDDGHSDLGTKLKRYLHTQGVTDRDYAFAYLVTAPRFLGYSFNPVSFWYLYDSDAKLKYMILEVNNTFDERRLYLLHAEEDITTTAGEKVFTDSFEKDFHVSPFNSRKGSYSLRAVDPLAAYERTSNVKIDNTIVLRSSKESTKIVARVWSEGLPHDATTIGPLSLSKFITRWWWVGFLTFPRIIWEAQKLYFRRQLHVWYRPEVVETSIGRPYTAEEEELERSFRAFLEAAVACTKEPLCVSYTPAHEQEHLMHSPGFTYEEEQKSTLSLRIVTPAFYSRFVHYARAKEALYREGMATDEMNRTVIIHPFGLLTTLLEGVKSLTSKSENGGNSIATTLRWQLLRRLRCPPPAVSYPEKCFYGLSDIRAFGHAEIDVFARQDLKLTAAYVRTVTKLFLASRFAFGTPVIVATVDRLFRGLLIMASMWFCDYASVIDVLRPRPYDMSDMSRAAALFAVANAIYIWELLKS